MYVVGKCTNRMCEIGHYRLQALKSAYRNDKVEVDALKTVTKVPGMQKHILSLQ